MDAHREVSPQRGAVLATTLHVVLLLLVLGQIVYLASRHRVRVDLTSDKLWSSTTSTRDLVAKLDKRLVIEAYFSPKEKLPVTVRESRAWADNFLDELVQIGKGKIVVQRFDPNADKAIADKATRVGIQPIDLASRTSTSVSQDRHWQGLRLVYGGGKQKVVKQFAPPSSFVAEAIVTPAIKEVMTGEKRKFGYMEWPATNPGGPQQGGLGWNTLRTHEGIAKLYEFQNFKDEDGALLPPDLDTLFLFRPKDLTDRQKYVLDQFVVKGGTLVAFVDAAEYLIGPNRNFTRMPLALDAAGSKQQFPQQLQHYGIDWRPRLVADLARDACTPRNQFQVPQEYYCAIQMDRAGRPSLALKLYPYFFHPVAREWRDTANDLAKDQKTGQVDQALAEQYRKQFHNGLPSDEFLFQAFKASGRGPGLYWPTWVGLREKAGGVADLPPDVEGRVLMWSSPLALVEDPPQSLVPISGNDPQQREEFYTKFVGKLNERLLGETRQQVPLMVEVKGRFSSYFAGQERPKRPSEIKEEEAKKAAAAAGETPPTTPPDVANPDAVAAKPQDAPAVVAEAAMVERGDKAGRIVLVGDSDFIRDDLVNQTYVQAGGPYSGNTAGAFFKQMLDWLAEDRDLVALQSKVAADRTLKLVDNVAASGADPRLQEQELRSKTNWLRAINVVAPGLLLVVLGLCVWAWRRAQKRSFLATVN